MRDVIKIKSFNTPAEAELAKGYLEANGIQSFVLVNDEGAAYPFLTSLDTGIQLFVATKDEKEAKILFGKLK